MAEEYNLDIPETTPAIVVNKYQIRIMTFDFNSTAPMVSESGIFSVSLIDNNGKFINVQYTGQKAKNIMKTLNTGNFTNVSMQKKIMQQLEKDGQIGSGSVSGTPDPPDPIE